LAVDPREANGSLEKGPDILIPARLLHLVPRLLPFRLLVDILHDIVKRRGCVDAVDELGCGANDASPGGGCETGN
jgi:hypothetical protein